MNIPMFLKRKRTYIWLGILILVVIGAFFLFRPKSPKINTITVQAGDIHQVISSTGQISADDRLDLSFDHAGRITSVRGGVGDKIVIGQIIARLDSADLQAQYQSSTASVLAAQAKYDQLINGARTEDLNVLETSLNNAKTVLERASTRDSVTVSRTAFNTAVNSLVTLTDLVALYPGKIDSGFTQKIMDGKEKVLFDIFGEPYLGKADSWYIVSLQTGLPAKISDYDANPSAADGIGLLADIKKIMTETEDVLDSAYSGLDLAGATSAHLSQIITAKTNILTQFTAINNQEQAIITAKNNVANFQSQLDLKKAPPTQYEIDIAQSQLTQAKAAQNQIAAQIEKTILRSPISGIIAGLDIRVGEIASPNITAATVIGQLKYQIEANVPEVDVAKIKVGNSAIVTLDAYGPDVFWNAVVTKIYPAEKVIEGVPTYKTIIAINGIDDRVKPGMTANLDIQNESRQNVLFIPQRAIIRQDGKKYVKLVLPENYASDARFADISAVTEDNGAVTADIEIQTGLYGSDGRVEILGGLEEGDVLITE